MGWKKRLGIAFAGVTALVGAFAGFVSCRSSSLLAERLDVTPHVPELPTDPARIAHGERLARSVFDCDHCHVAKGDALDYASDDKREKKAARVMIHMTSDINQKLRAVTTETRVSCWTCHRGEAKPEPTPVVTPRPK